MSISTYIYIVYIYIYIYYSTPAIKPFCTLGGAMVIEPPLLKNISQIGNFQIK